MSSEPWTIRRVLTWTTQHFEKRQVDAPRLTAEILLSHVLELSRVRLYVDLDRPLSKDELGAYRALIERRMAGEPTQYLTGVREFYNRPFKVDARVLIPRPETELLVEAALRMLPKDAPGRALDVCTGSGCIAISLAAERPQATVIATDLSPDACALARENAQALGVADRVTVLQGDLFTPVPAGERFQVVVSNPPYIASGEIPGLSAEVRREPKLALDGGPDGLVAVRRVVTGARQWLEPGGLLALEIGEDQGPAVLELLRAAGYADARVEKDLERRERMAFGTQPVASEPQG
ncbi:MULTISPECIES: peptide chain release factor N(5)-glutamine methyltransferase [Myxococcus]|uniref:Release factor glutamine methyltransferase n=2 Tax=Myxococcus TaxID=32 RepID=A0A511HFK9_9BACT|nr:MULTISPECIES: peptide chain release factor N(5)-glutamine methyltransferase [Myxococcus]NOJ83584.1 peptide chain release factor N(5)-glutamine methyltransferase [Myxococcus xanthus]NOJ90948.1 peptide chain release factor N(5)-glutamine methyltransferase [Myxococcus xanthus]QQR42315.1 peptide chain release factor N(5)-glutamine methyltransferase [Myxococcus xanthus]WNZ59612.1 peptide chain release factor N(5)-glutamine methyltransferase [Myxococcus sp. MxC21-1]SDE85315.1 release factor gluta